MKDVRTTLTQRSQVYGNFADQARVEQNIKRAFAASPNWSKLPDDTKSALEMIATKISRVLKGDPEHVDNFVDLAGYATLVADRMTAAAAAAAAVQQQQTQGQGDQAPAPADEDDGA